MAPSDEDMLLDELRRSLAATDAIPEPVQVAARAAIEWRALDSELAALFAQRTACLVARPGQP